MIEYDQNLISIYIYDYFKQKSSFLDVANCCGVFHVVGTNSIFYDHWWSPNSSIVRPTYKYITCIYELYINENLI